MKARRSLAAAGLLLVMVLAAACSSGSSGTKAVTSGSTPVVTSPASNDTGSASSDSGSVSSDSGSVGSDDTGAPGGAYCAAARTYDSDLAHFSADDTAAVNLAVKDITELHSKAPKVIKDDYAVLLRVLKEVQASGPDAVASDELGSYQEAFQNVIDYDHTHCGLPAY
jgi:hypothetical protein